MTYLVVYDVVTSYSDAKLEVRRVGSDDGIARVFATAERAWLGEIFFDNGQVAEPSPPVCEPGYALVIDHGERGRPEQRPRDAHITLREYFEPGALLEDARRYARGVRPPAAVIGMRVIRRQPTADPGWSRETRLLHAETVAHPADDASRLVLADAIGGRRGALVVVQCDLARPGLTPAESCARRRAQREHLAKHGAGWSRLTGLAKRCMFRRGFVETAEISHDILVNDYARVFDAAPHLTSIAIDATPAVYVRQLAQASVRDGWWQRLRGLSIDSDMLANHFEGMFGDLRAFEMSRAAPQHVTSLVETGLRDLEILGLPSHTLAADALDAIIRTSPDLRVLDVSSATFPRALAIPESVRELYVTGGRPVAFPRQLEKLAVFGPYEPHALDGLTSLRSLDLSAGFGHVGLEELSLPALRELRIANKTPAQVVAIARSFGRQLELYDLRGIAGVESIHDELRELVAGDIWLGKLDLHKPLMPASYLPDEPMWDVGVVDLSG